jgi:uncharacterized membrane protein
MNTMKLRLILMGFILTVLGVALIGVKGFSTELLILPVIGILLAVVGLIWRPQKKEQKQQ